MLLALKKYGAIVADNGDFFSVSVCPDDRFADGAFDHLSTIGINNFEVVQTTGPNEGPRSPGAPIAAAGADQTIVFGTVATLQGVVAGMSSVTTQWKLYSGPAAVSFGSSSQLATTASFSLPGRYILMLSADDGIHAVAYDAVVIDVTLPVIVQRGGSDLVLRFPTLAGCIYRALRTDTLPAAWVPLTGDLAGTGSEMEIIDPGALHRPSRFYRVQVVSPGAQPARAGRRFRR